MMMMNMTNDDTNFANNIFFSDIGHSCLKSPQK